VENDIVSEARRLHKNEVTRAWNARNKDKVLAAVIKWQKANPKKVSAARLAWQRANPSKIRASQRKWNAANPGSLAFMSAKRRASKRKATPPWLTHEQYLEIRRIYARAKREGKEVDHIIPLTHPRVCGLHVPWNLQLLTKSENCRKGNRLVLP